MISKQGEARLMMSVVNLGKVYYIMAKRVGEQTTREHIKALQHAMTIVDVDQAAVIEASSLKYGHQISYADSFAASLALGRELLWCRQIWRSRSLVNR